jgi:hypothetical protein
MIIFAALCKLEINYIDFKLLVMIAYVRRMARSSGLLITQYNLPFCEMRGVPNAKM